MRHVLTFALAFVIALPVLADDRPVYPCFEVTGAPAIDGVVEGDAAWADIPRVSGFHALGGGYTVAKQSVALACRDADRLGHVGVLELAAIRQQSISLGKDSDQDRSDLQKALMLICAQGGQQLQPFLRSPPFIEGALHFFGRQPNMALDRRIGDDDEVVRLHVSPAGRGRCGAQTVLDDAGRHGPIGELAHRPPPLQVLIEGNRPPRHLLGRVFAVGCERDKSRFFHHGSRRFCHPSTAPRRAADQRMDGQDYIP